MRKIYLAAVMALSASLSGTAYNTTIKHVEKNLHEFKVDKGLTFTPAPTIDAQTIKDVIAKTGRNFSQASSRADEAVSFNFTDYYLWTFFDPEVNFYDDNGYQLSEITSYISSTETVMREVGDSIEIYWYYFNDVPYTFYVTSDEQNQPILELGQQIVDGPLKFYVTENGVTREVIYNVFLGAAFLEQDPDNPDASGDIVVKTDGVVQFYMSSEDNNVIATDAVALYVMLQEADDPNGEFIPFHSIMLSQLCKPNATIAYQFYTVDDDDQPVLLDVNSPIYYSYDENSYAPYPDEPNTLYDSYFVSCVTPYGMGIGVNIVRFEVEAEYSPTGFLWMADSQPAFPSQRVSQTSVSGKLYMNSVTVDANDYFNFYDPSYPVVTFKEGEYTDKNGKKYKALTFPNSIPDCDDEMEYWGLTSKVQDFAVGYYTPAVIVFDFVGNAFEGEPDDPSGIQDVIQDAFEGTAEYYDLQGIKVANPAPGKIYIVKEGSKVSKRIF